ncbi:MAG TPA: glycerophosphodiester phosphodiesterase [Planctomycetota bacterium]|nr:glycerophosphodiester phosphodiesterase [Planctomycetota bacterium]
MRGFLLLVLFAAAGCAGAERRGGPAVVAHRGASHEAPENTLASVELAWKEGADAVEVDIFLTRDGEIAVIHDETTKRTTRVDWKVASRTLEELRTLEAGSWKHSRFAGQRIPTLDEVLAAVPDGKQLLVEIKCGPEVIPRLRRAIEESGKQPEQVRIIGFGLETVRQVRLDLPRHRVSWLSGWKRDRTSRRLTTVESLVAAARDAGVHGLSLKADGPLDEEAVRQIREAGLEFHVWTVNDEDLALRMAALGADSITTDRPAWLTDLLARASRAKR